MFAWENNLEIRRCSQQEYVWRSHFAVAWFPVNGASFFFDSIWSEGRAHRHGWQPKSSQLLPFCFPDILDAYRVPVRWYCPSMTTIRSYLHIWFLTLLAQRYVCLQLLFWMRLDFRLAVWWIFSCRSLIGPRSKLRVAFIFLLHSLLNISFFSQQLLKDIGGGTFRGWCYENC